MNEILEEAKKSAENYVGKSLFILVNTDGDVNKKIQDLFGIKENMLPAIRLMVAKAGNYTKYMPEEKEITAQVINKFLDDFFAQKLQPYIKYQEPPADWNEQPVKFLVSKTFEQIVYDKKKNVFVVFCKFI